MEFKKILTLFAVFLAVSGVALALPGANIESSTPQERWSGDPAADQNDTTEGGNVTFLELNGTSLTDRWAGYYGNISSVVLYLTDETGGSSNHLYQWTGAGGPADWTSGIVCAAQDSAFDWSNAAAATVTMSIAALVKMAVDDYVEVMVQHNSGAAQDISAADTSNLHLNSAAFYRIA